MVNPARLGFSAVVLCLAAAALPAGEPVSERPEIRDELMVRITGELSRLEAASAADSGLPGASRELAFFLLSGLAADQDVIERLTDDERGQFGLRQPGGTFNQRLVALNDNARIAFHDRIMQDKTGSYTVRSAALFARQDGTWLKRDYGAVVVREKR